MKMRMKDIRKNMREQTCRKHLRRNITFAVAEISLVAVLPLLARLLTRVVHARCQRMMHEMEFGERPSCQMCYDMHRAMHRRMEKEVTIILPSDTPKVAA